MSLSRFKVAGNAKVDEVESVSRRSCHIPSFEITENNRRLVRVQVVQHGTQLNTDVEGFPHWEISTMRFSQIGLQGFPCNEVHHQVPASCLGKIVMDLGEIGVVQSDEQVRLALESSGGFDQLLHAQTALTQLLAGHEFLANQGILCLIAGSHPALARLI